MPGWGDNWGTDWGNPTGVIESCNAIDSTSASTVLSLATRTEATSASEFSSVTLKWFMAVSEALTVVDIPNATIVRGVGTVSESANASDQPSAVSTRLAGITEGASASDGTLSLANWIMTYQESNTWSYNESTGNDYRTVIPASEISTSGNKIRIKIKASTDGSWLLEGCSIGPRSGSTDDFSSPPTRITFDNGSSSTTIEQNVDKWSDEILFFIDETKDYLIHVYSTADPVYYSLANGTYSEGYYSTPSSPDDTLVQTVSYSLVSARFFVLEVDVIAPISVNVTEVANALDTPSATQNTIVQASITEATTPSDTITYFNSVSVAITESASATEASDKVRLVPMMPAMTSNTTPSPWVLTNGTNWIRVLSLFDDNTSGSTGGTVGAVNGWCRVYSGGTIETIFAYSITFNGTLIDPIYAPKTWTLEGSNDNASWDLLDSRTNVATWPSALEERTYFLTSTGYYKYFRLTFLANFGGTVTTCHEIEFWMPGDRVTADVIESVTALDVQSNIVTGPSVITEQATADDLCVESVDYAVSVSEPANALDDSDFAGSLIATIVESAFAIDEVSKVNITTASITESVTASDSLSEQTVGTIEATITESCSALDGLLAANITLASIIESVTATDRCFVVTSIWTGLDIEVTAMSYMDITVETDTYMSLSMEAKV